MNFAKTLTLIALVMAATCLTASAQDHAIKFKLTREVSVGSATLRPGDYRMVMYTTNRLMTIISPVSGSGHAVIALPSSYAADRKCPETSLTFMPNGGRWHLSSVCLANEQLALYFRVPDRKKYAVATQATDTAALAGAP